MNRNKFREVTISRIKIDENRDEQIIVLKEVGGNRFLPVAIGMNEVAAIKFKLRGIEPPRPMTHDLLWNVIKELGAELREVVIDKLDGYTFFAKIVLLSGEKEVVIDARPSDSIALALRAEAPIFVVEDVLAEAGINM